MPLPAGARRGPDLPGAPRTARPPLTDSHGPPDTDLNAVICKGGLLQDIHRRYIFHQLLRATKFIHSGGVVHRDQKVPPSPCVRPPPRDTRPAAPAPHPSRRLSPSHPTFSSVPTAGRSCVTSASPAPSAAPPRGRRARP